MLVKHREKQSVLCSLEQCIHRGSWDTLLWVCAARALSPAGRGMHPTEPLDGAAWPAQPSWGHFSSLQPCPSERQRPHWPEVLLGAGRCGVSGVTGTLCSGDGVPEPGAAEEHSSPGHALALSVLSLFDFGLLGQVQICFQITAWSMAGKCSREAATTGSSSCLSMLHRTGALLQHLTGPFLLCCTFVSAWTVI